MTQTTVQVAGHSELVLDPKMEALYRHSAATVVDRILRLLPAREVDRNNVVPVFGDIKTLRNAIIELDSRFAAYRQRIADHSKSDAGCDCQPRFAVASASSDSDGEALTFSDDPGGHQSKHLRVLTIQTDDFAVEVDFTHDSSLTGYGADLVSAPTAPGEAPTSAGGDIVRVGTDTVPGSDSPVGQSAATGAAAPERPHPTNPSPPKNAGAA